MSDLIQVFETDQWSASDLVSGREDHSKIKEFIGGTKMRERSVHRDALPDIGCVWLVKDETAINGWRIYRARYDSSD